MKRTISKKQHTFWNWLKRHCVDWPGYGLVCAFWGVSAAINLQVAYASGGDSFVAWTMVVLAFAGQAFIALGPVYTLGRGKIIASILALPLWLVCVLYSWNAALTFFDSNLADAKARKTVAQQSFQDVRSDLKKARHEREQIETERSVSLITTEIAAILNKPGRYGKTLGERTAKCTGSTHRAPKDCSLVNSLRIELKSAQNRDDLNAQIISLTKKLANTKAVGQTRSQYFLSPLLAHIHLITGIEIRTPDDLRILMLLLIAEIGAAFCPMIMSLAKRRKEVRQEHSEILYKQPEDSKTSRLKPSYLSSIALSDPKAHKFSEWFGQRIDLSVNGYISASDLYADFVGFLGGEDAAKQAGINIQNFGRWLTQDLGLDKTKRGKSCKIHYLGIRMRSSKHPLALTPASSCLLSSLSGQRSMSHGVAL
ncbi:MAG: hypothetical protein AAF228_03545 [Pseudomonadota bacterium]